MTEKLRQSLSAVVDDEADAFEMRRVLDEMSRDPELRRLWDRYHMVGSVLRREVRRPVPDSLRDQVWAAISDEPVAAAQLTPEPAPEAAAGVAESTAGAMRGRAGRLMSLGVAASVAFAVVLGFNALQTGDVETEAVVAGVAAPSPVAVRPVSVPQIATRSPVAVTPLATRFAGGSPELAVEIKPSDLQRAHAYMQHHARHQGLNQSGVMSFVKMATYEAP